MPFADNDGIRIHYEVEGEGPPLVLCHGYLGSSEGWRINGYVEALKDYYKLILLDARGHGYSARAQQLIELPEKGFNDTEIAEKLGTTQSTVSVYRRRLGLKPIRARPLGN